MSAPSSTRGRQPDAEGAAWMQLKCWNRDCGAPLAAIKKRSGYADVRCRVCGGEWLMYVAREMTPHGGEGWSITLIEPGLTEEEARHVVR